MTDNKPTHSDELKACPFCGGEADTLFDFRDRQDSTGDEWVQCKKCSASSEKFAAYSDAKEKATLAWNTRASTPPAPQAEGEVVPIIAEDEFRNVCSPILSGQSIDLLLKQLHNYYPHGLRIRKDKA